MLPAAPRDSPGGGNGVRKATRKSRGRGLRTTTGCVVCRRRHMKCDEQQPRCGPCAKGNRTCSYPSSTSGQEPIETKKEPESYTQLQPQLQPQLHPQLQPQPQSQHQRQHQHQKLPQISLVDPDPGPLETGPGPHTRFSPVQQSDTQWPTPANEEPLQNPSPRSNYSSSTGYGVEVAPLRWFGLLAGDVASDSFDLQSLESLGDAALAQRYRLQPNGLSADGNRPSQTPAAFANAIALHNPSQLLSISAVSPTPLNAASGSTDEKQFWQAFEPIRLRGHEYHMFQRFVTGVSLWIDLFDPLKHFSTFVPHLAIHNEGLMKALLALGARHLSIRPLNSGEAIVDRTAAVQYYYETLRYLQSAMRFTSYKNSPELLATVLVVSTYEMIDGASKGWERHLKGVFWIQRSRDINGESGGLEQAIWWAWLRQDIWAAYRERRRCFSFFKPTKPYHAMDLWDMASRIVYILAQCVNYSSDEERQTGEKDLSGRIRRADVLLEMLDEWLRSISVHFQPLPVENPSSRPFRPMWIHPPALGASMQMYSMARILIFINKPAAGGYLEYQDRERNIVNSIDTIGGIALQLSDDASRLMSTQCLFAAGIFCKDAQKQQCIAELIRDAEAHTGWPSNTDLAEELEIQWAEQRPG